MWHRAEVAPRFFEIAFQAVQAGSRPPRLETFAAALSGGGRPHAADVVHQGPVRAYVSEGVILLPCAIPAGTASFDTLAIYNDTGELMATCPYPTSDADEGVTALVYMDFPRE